MGNVLYNTEYNKYLMNEDNAKMDIPYIERKGKVWLLF